MHIYVACRLLGDPRSIQTEKDVEVVPCVLSLCRALSLKIRSMHVDFAPGHFRPGSLGCLAHRAPYSTEAGMTATYAELADALSLALPVLECID